jgi:arylformamidase
MARTGLPLSVAAMAFFDISLPIRDGMMVYEGDPGVSVTSAMALDRGDPANVSMLKLGSHTGTHLDAPLHFIDGAPGVDTLPLDVLIGPARVVEIDAASLIEPEHLASRTLEGCSRRLIKTRNSALWDRPAFSRDYTALSEAGARLLLEHGVKLIGVDYLSIEAFGADGHRVHRLLLGAGVVILEGLDFRRVTPGDYELICLPLRIAGGDGSPCRAVLRG